MVRQLTIALAILLLAACGAPQTATTPTTADATIGVEAPTTAPTEAVQPTTASEPATAVIEPTMAATEVATTTETTADATTTSEATTATDGAFPVTLAHKYGETTITKEPQRIVTVGLIEQDTLIALGIAPVGVSYWFGEEDAIGIWAQDAFDALGAPAPTVLNDPSGLSFEAIAALKPDLILALYAGLTQEEYDLLTAIAPTIAQPSEYIDYGIPWQELTRKVGQAVGKAATADALIADTEARFLQEQQEHPELVGRSMVVVSTYEGISLHASEDPRSQFFEALGLKVPDSFDPLFGDSFYAVLSLEEAAQLDLDLVIWISADSLKAPNVLGGPVYQTLDVHKEGREAFINDTDPQVYEAISFASVLSIPYTLDIMVPRLVAAIDGDPTTADTGMPANVRATPADATTTSTVTATETSE